MSDATVFETQFRPITALRAVARLLRNPEDTRQVFVVMTALRGRSGKRMLARFLKSPVGARVAAEHRNLLDCLQDRAALAALPEGSVGRAYLAFMDEEQLTADGLVEASEAGWSSTVSPAVSLFRNRMRDMHDLTHIVTGYGRDGLGELCLLAFMFRHTGNLGGALIALMGWLKATRMGAGRLVGRAVAEGFRGGGKSAWLPGQDWEALMARPLDEVRRELNIVTPTRYLAVQS
jgi:ubiquinone biosynthesis protein COQ4